MKILIVGGGIAGPAAAWWLARDGHQVTIVERFPVLRSLGAQIDLRDRGLDVVRKMGLMDVIRTKLVDEAGVGFVDTHNNLKAVLMANTSGRGRQGPTSEFEIMRGDLVKILYDATKDDVRYVFGKTVDSFAQDDARVTVAFSDGSTDAYDLLVGADGQSSRIRRDILPPGAPDPLKHLGVYMAYYFIPRTEADDNIRKVYHVPGGRLAFTRCHSAHEAQSYLAVRTDSAEARAVPRASLARQKEFWTGLFQGTGWQTDRLLAGMQTTDNFYCQEIVQVKAPVYSKGRVVLLGDAASCPSPLTGMGTSSALVAAYVLAGELARSGGDLRAALANYDATLRPYVDEFQKMAPFQLDLMYLQSRLAITLFHAIFAVVLWLRVPQLMQLFMSEKKGGWVLPEYSAWRKER